MLKKSLTALALASLVSFAACGGGEEANEGDAVVTDTATTVAPAPVTTDTVAPMTTDTAAAGATDTAATDTAAAAH